MGGLMQVECASMEDRMKGLRLHLQANFYPKLPAEVQQKIAETLRKHMEDGYLEDDHEKLADECCLTNVDALYRYFGAFLRHDHDCTCEECVEPPEDVTTQRDVLINCADHEHTCRVFASPHVAGFVLQCMECEFMWEIPLNPPVVLEDEHGNLFVNKEQE